MLIVNAIITCYNIVMNKNSPIIRIIIALTIIYLFFVVGRTLYQNYQVKKQINNLKNNITEMQATNKDLAQKITYYKSSSYQERIARERLGLQKDGEKVIVILPEDTKKVSEKDPYDLLTGPQKWWKFFFKN